VGEVEGRVSREVVGPGFGAWPPGRFLCDGLGLVRPKFTSTVFETSLAGTSEKSHTIAEPPNDLIDETKSQPLSAGKPKEHDSELVTITMLEESAVFQACNANLAAP
jgi:hypothetical protein